MIAPLAAVRCWSRYTKGGVGLFALSVKSSIEGGESKHSPWFIRGAMQKGTKVTRRGFVRKSTTTQAGFRKNPRSQ